MAWGIFCSSEETVSVLLIVLVFATLEPSYQPKSRNWSSKTLIAISLLRVSDVYSMISWQSSLYFFMAAASAT